MNPSPADTLGAQSLDNDYRDDSHPRSFAEEVRNSITDLEFTQLSELIYRLAGIRLGSAKRALLVGRLTRRLRVLGLRTFNEYYRHVIRPENEAERTMMLDCLCTNETAFFREPAHFQYLEQFVYPAYEAEALSGKRNRTVRVWSAACSTGEEPYSVAMHLLDRFPPAKGWTIEVVGTDLSTKVLDRAKSGIWPVDKTGSIPRPYLKSFMLKGYAGMDGMVSVDDQLRSVVQFQPINLFDGVYPVHGEFDLVFLRNVMIYFDLASRQKVLNRVIKHLKIGGYLFLGHAEGFNDSPERFQRLIPTVYRLTSRAEAAP